MSADVAAQSYESASSSVGITITQSAPVVSRGFNFSLLKLGTILQAAVGAFITTSVVVATVIGVTVFATTVKYDFPLANPDSAVTFKITPVKIFVLLNDIDPRQANLTLTKIHVEPRYGKAKIVDNQYIVYTPDKYYAGYDSLNYTVKNDKLEAQTIVHITVLNHPPEVVPQYYLINKNSLNNKADIFSFRTTAGLKVSDLDDDKLDVVGVTQPQYGQATYDSKNVYYTPNKNFNGIDVCNYTVSDGNDTATEVLTFEVFNSAPVANPDYDQGPKNQNKVISVLLNDYDVNQDELNVTFAGNAVKGNARVTDDSKKVEYVPSITTETTTDSFEYGITDGFLTASSYGVITLINSPPYCSNFDADPPVPTNAINHRFAIKINKGSQVGVYGDNDLVEKLTLSFDFAGTRATSWSVQETTVTTNIETYAGGEKFINNQYKTYAILYTPATGQRYEETVKYTVTDSGKLTATCNIRIVVGNVKPNTPTVTYPCSKRRSTTINVMVNVTDPNGDPTTLARCENGPTTRGSVTTFNSSHCTYTAPSDGSMEDDTFVYIGRDIPQPGDTILNNTGTVRMTIYNEAPFAVDDVATVPKGLTTNIDILKIAAGNNDNDPNYDFLWIHTLNPTEKNATIATIQLPQNGRSTDHVRYTALNALYTDTFTYFNRDENNTRSVLPATVTVIVVNTPPVPVDDSVTLYWNTTTTIDVLANDTDANPGDKSYLTIVSVTQGNQGGTVAFTAQQITYTPRLGFVGQETFTYMIQDQYNVSLTSATVRCNVINDAPIAVNDAYTKHHAVASVLLDVTANDYDARGDSIVLLSTTLAGRTSVVSSSGKLYVQYSSAAGFTGIESFQYYISDWNLAAVATVTMNITDTPPTGNGDSLTVHWNNTATQTVNVITNDVDADGDSISATGSLNPQTGFRGTVSRTGDNVNFNAPGNWKGVQTVGYTVTDGALSSTGTLTITVTNNDVPTAPAIVQNYHWRTQFVGTVIPILNKYSDADGDSLTFTNTNPSLGGTVTAQSDALSVLYKHTSWTGTENFQYTVSDGLDQATGLVTVTVFNNPPTAGNVNVTINPADFSTGILIDVRPAISDVNTEDVPFLSLTNVYQSPNAQSITIQSGQVRYIPKTGFSGTDSFTYTASDGLAQTNGTVFVVVPFFSPAANDKFVKLHWRTQFTGSLLYQTNWTLTQITTAPTKGSAFITGQNVNYTQNAGYLGFDLIQTKYTDTFSTENRVNNYITVYNNLPTAAQQAACYHWRALVNGVLINVTIGSNDTDNDPISLVGANNATRGTTSLVSGFVQYKSATGWLTSLSGNDTFSFTLSDGLQTGGNTVIVCSLNSLKPSAPNLARTYHWRSVTGASQSIDVLASTTAADGDTLTLSVVSAPSGVVHSVVGGTNITYRHDNFLGVETIQYKVNDGIEEAFGIITITTTNTAPTPLPDSYNLHWRTAVGVTLSPSAIANDTDPNSDPITIVSSGSGSGGGTTSFTSTNIVYSKPATVVASETFSYSVSDTKATSSSTVTIFLTNTAPVANNVAATVLWRNSVGLTGSCTDANSDPLTFFLQAPNAKGNLTGYSTSTGAGTYKPLIFTFPASPDADGTYRTYDAFGYRCTDTVANSNLGYYNVTITDRPPVPLADSYIFAHDRNNNPQRTLNVAANDTDPDGDSVRVTSFTNLGSSGATISISGDGQNLLYLPPSSFVGTDTISYTLFDGAVSATGFATVIYTNVPPVCNNLVVTVWKNQPPNKWYLMSNASCTDANNDPLTLSLPSLTTSKGTLQLLSDAQGQYVLYTPNTHRSGADSFNFVVGDSYTTSTFSVTINIPNGAPLTPAPKQYKFDKWPTDRTYDVAVLDQCFDPDNDPLTLLSLKDNGCVASGLLASAPVIVGNNVRVTVKANKIGSCNFTYTFHDNDVDNRKNATGIVNSVIVLNLPPVAIDDHFSTDQGNSFTVLVSTLLSNDYDVNNDTISFDALVCNKPNVTCLKTPQLQGSGASLSVFIPADVESCGPFRFEYRIKTASDGLNSTGSIILTYINCKCFKPVDICFVLDGSGSIASGDWTTGKSFAAAIVDKFVVAPDKVNVGVVQFSGCATHQYQVVGSQNRYYGFTMMSSSNSAVTTRINSLIQLKSSTATIAGLDKAVQMVSAFGRSGIPKTLILLTDGAPNRPCGAGGGSNCASGYTNNCHVGSNCNYNSIGSCNHCTNYYTPLGGTSANCTHATDWPGQTCSNCAYDSSTDLCLPCSDPRDRARAINSFGNWRIVTIGVGDGITPLGQQLIDGCAYSPTASFNVDWNQLNSIAQAIVDLSCNQA